MPLVLPELRAPTGLVFLAQREPQVQGSLVQLDHQELPDPLEESSVLPEIQGRPDQKDLLGLRGKLDQ